MIFNIEECIICIYILWLSVCLFISNKHPPVTPGKVYEWSKFQKFVFKFFFIFVKFWKCVKKIIKICKIFYTVHKKMITDKVTIKSWNRRWVLSALKSLCIEKKPNSVTWYIKYILYYTVLLKKKLVFSFQNFVIN